jgi:DNA-directed RNA polymerase, mitochondrial
VKAIGPGAITSFAASRVVGRNTAEIGRFLIDKALPRAMKGIDIDRLLVMGITAAAGDGIGVDKDGVKNFRDQALWLGQNLVPNCKSRELEFKVGAWSIDMLCGLPVFAIEDGVLTLPLTPSLDEWLNEAVERGLQSCPFIWPLAEAPQSWTQVSKGGLSPDHWARPSFISGHKFATENAVRKAIADRKMQPVLDAVGYLAGAAFKINKPLLDFIRRREESRIENLSGEIAALNREAESRKLKWSQRLKRANLRAELSVWELDMQVASLMACRDRFFVPLRIEFRGRISPIPFFNFTREDHIRALFLFKDGLPIGDDGLQWLKAHVAACANGNKWSTVGKTSDLDFAGRIAWVENNLPCLLKVGTVVLRGDDPSQIEWLLEGIGDPYQFCAACCELVQAVDEGSGFETRLPLMFDAACSGLQHICAMTRAEEGRYVNLVPADEAFDFYCFVGATIWRERPELQHLFEHGNPFDRKIIKRPGLTYGYGSKAGGFGKRKHARRYRPYGMTQQIVAVLKERGESTKDAQALAAAAYETIEKLMPAAKVVRVFLEQIVGICNKYNIPLRLTTSLGLPVLNAYYIPIKKTMSVKLNGRRRRANLIIGDTDKIDKRKAKNSITANVVHSSDAAHLQLVALAAAKENIQLATIHDCFGPRAPQAKRLNEILREQFTRLHKRHNWLNAIRESAKKDLPKRAHRELPELPKIGNLDIDGVLKSFFASK